jgi:AraC family transcriptional regulator
MITTLRAGSGPIETSITERLNSTPLSRNSFPRVYEEALVTILHLVFGQTGSSVATTEAPRTDRATSRFAAATDFVEENLDRKIALRELASLAALSVSRFSHAFKAEYGMSPYHYLIVRRIERAKTLLRTTDDTVASIAQRAGFTSQGKFSDSFGKVAGVTPSAYRHEQR